MTRHGDSTIVVVRTGSALATRAGFAQTPIQRMTGLLARDRMADGEALLFPRCRSIHTWGMRFPIDVVFVDRAWTVVALKERVGPWRIVLPVWPAWGVVELAEGAIERAGLRVGDCLHVAAEGDGTACGTRGLAG